jgi:hypothetical protein
MKQKMMNKFDMSSENTDFNSGLTKIMQHFAAIDAVN